jgi:hypothetical protein
MQRNNNCIPSCVCATVLLPLLLLPPSCLLLSHNSAKVGKYIASLIVVNASQLIKK